MVLEYQVKAYFDYSTEIVVVFKIKCDVVKYYNFSLIINNSKVFCWYYVIKLTFREFD